MSDYQAALTRGKREGAGRCDDAAAMALYCDGPLQIAAGAVSPKLVWQGAQKSGLTLSQLNEMAMTAPLKVADLMWL